MTSRRQSKDEDVTEKVTEKKGCAHDGGELIGYAPDSFKAGRTYCATCRCSFRDGELVTRGAECAAFAPTKEPAGE